MNFNHNSLSKNKKPLSDRGPKNIGINQLSSVYHHYCDYEIEEGNVEKWVPEYKIENSVKWKCFKEVLRDSLIQAAVLLVCFVAFYVIISFFEWVMK